MLLLGMQKIFYPLPEVVFYSKQTPALFFWPFGPSITGGWLLTLSKFVFIGLILALLVYLLRHLFGPGGSLRDSDLDSGGEKEESLDILRKRLAKGEITEQEFKQKKRLIQDD